MKTENKNPPSSRHYKFGTFEDRLEHICLLFDTEGPNIEYEENTDVALLSDNLIAWIEQYEICMDWLFLGNPDGLLKHWASRKNSFEYIISEVFKLDADGLREVIEFIEEIQSARNSNN